VNYILTVRFGVLVQIGYNCLEKSYTDFLVDLRFVKFGAGNPVFCSET
jgi:hypothetical protein